MTIKHILITQQAMTTPPTHPAGRGMASNFWEPDSAERILILAPHPDDEILAAGGLIASVKANSTKSQIRVVVATNGDASYLGALFYGRHSTSRHNFHHLAIKRQQESLSALIMLGLNAEHVQFLGFPDRGLSALHRHWNKPYRSPTTGFNQSEQVLHDPKVPYTGLNFLALLQKVLSEFHPTTIIMPHLQDAHPDHRALAQFTYSAITSHQLLFPSEPLSLLSYLVWERWKFSKQPANTLSQLRQFFLSQEIYQQKKMALQCFQTQKLSAAQPISVSKSNAYEEFWVALPDSVSKEITHN